MNIYRQATRWIVDSFVNSESKLLTDLKDKIGIIIVLVAIMIVFSILSPYFLTYQNIRIILRQNAVAFVLATAMTIVLISGNIDLSIGSNLAFSSVLVALFMQQYGMSGILPGITVGLVGGLGVGLLNGFFIGKWKLNSLLVTLATMTLVRGLAYVISKGFLISRIPRQFIHFIGRSIGPITVLVFFAAIIGIIVYIFLSKTIYGEYVKGIGSNSEAAGYCGIPVAKYTLFVFAISGLLSAVAGIMLLGDAGSTVAYIATGVELDAIAAAIIGGTSFAGGEGSIGGTVIGVLIIATIHNGLTLLGVSTSYLKLARGLILVTVVIFDILRRGKAAG